MPHRTKLLERAIDQLAERPAHEQDEIAELLFAIVANPDLLTRFSLESAPADPVKTAPHRRRRLDEEMAEVMKPPIHLHRRA